MGGGLLPLLALPGVASAHPVSTYVKGPDDDWCAFINEAWAGGDLILLEPGDYFGPCTIEGKPIFEEDETTIVQALDATNRPRFWHDGSSGDPILRITGEHVGLLHLEFPELPEGITAVEVDGLDRFWLRFLQFPDARGTAIVVRKGEDVRIQDSWFAGATVVELGCERRGCDVPDLLFRGNLLDESRVIVHPRVWGTVSDNIGQGEQGPLIDYRGSGGDGVVEGNLLLSGGEALNLESDDVLVRNNIVVGGLISRGDAALLGNTLLGPVDRSGGTFTSNALLADSAPSGNVACPTLADCWVDAEGWDFRPVEGGPLWDAGLVDPLLEQDFCGTTRGRGPDAGALEHTEAAGPLQFELKSRQPCAGLTPHVPEEPEPEPDAGAEASKGCGCAVGSGEVGSGALLGLMGMVLARRKRSRRVRTLTGPTHGT